jgi:hypothetical protein
MFPELWLLMQEEVYVDLPPPHWQTNPAFHCISEKANTHTKIKQNITNKAHHDC